MHKGTGNVSPAGLAAILDQISRACYNFGFSNGLNPAQWAALRYLSKAGPQLRSVSGFARFQGSTVGTASRTISALVAKKMVAKAQSGQDGRQSELSLTDLGRSALEQDPLNILSRALESLSLAQQMVVAEAMEQVLREIASRGRSDDGKAADLSALEDG